MAEPLSEVFHCEREDAEVYESDVFQTTFQTTSRPLQVFHAAYCSHFEPSQAEQLRHIWKEYGDNCMAHMPELCRKNIYGNKLAPSRDIANHFAVVDHIRYICEGGLFTQMNNVPVGCASCIQDKCSSTLPKSQLLTMDPPFQILGLDFGDVRHQSVVQYSLTTMSSYTLFMYGQLLTALQLTSSGATLCFLRGFEAMALADETSLLNEFDCPLFSLAQTILSVDSSHILAAVFFVHECDKAWSYLDFEPLGVLCLVTSARSKGKTPKSNFVERSGVARSVRNRKLIA
ncbi:hypothetical protein EMCRGX_G013291 [Ephydatia muelleri]